MNLNYGGDSRPATFAVVPYRIGIHGHKPIKKGTLPRKFGATRFSPRDVVDRQAMGNAVGDLQTIQPVRKKAREPGLKRHFSLSRHLPGGCSRGVLDLPGTLPPPTVLA